MQTLASRRIADRAGPSTMLVLAGGFGTRLREVVAEVPKPLAPVGNLPFLQYLIQQWIVQGLSHFVFLLHHEAARMEAFLSTLRRQPFAKHCDLRAVIEEKPLGTGGAIANAVKTCGIRGAFLVANADTWIEIGVRQLANVNPPALGVLHVQNTDRYGAIEFARDRVLSFREKLQSTGPGWINAGIYHFHTDQFQEWNGKPFSLERELFPHLASSGSLRAVPLESHFIDIGVPQDYFRFCRWIESGRTGCL